MGRASYPLHLFSRNALLSTIEQQYRLVAELDALDGVIGFGRHRSRFKGFGFVAAAPGRTEKHGVMEMVHVEGALKLIDAAAGRVCAAGGAPERGELTRFGGLPGLERIAKLPPSTAGRTASAACARTPEFAQSASA